MNLVTELLSKFHKDKNDNNRDTQKQIDSYSVLLEELQEQMLDLERQAFSVKKEIIMKGTTKEKIVAEKVITHFETSILQQSMEKEKLILSRTNLRHKKRKLETELNLKRNVDNSFNYDEYHQVCDAFV